MPVISFFRGKKSYLKNKHFWVIISIIIVLIILYHYWPWHFDKYSIFYPYQSFFVNYARLEFKYHIIGSLFLIPYCYSTVIYWWRGTLFTFVISIPVLFPKLLTWNDPQHTITNMLFLLMPLIVVSIIVLEIQRRAKERQYYQEREKENRLFIEKVIEAQENERKRIAHELHDETIQTLSVVTGKLENLSTSNKNKQQVEQVKETVIQTINDIRIISRDLMPASLEKLGLVSALSLMVNQMNKECNAHITLTVLGEEYKLAPKIEINIFRIIQESLNNIKRHSNATEAKVELEFTSHKIKVLIQDNGKGFNMLTTTENFITQNKLGITGMKERVRLINGIIQINSIINKGTTVYVELPC